MITPADLLPHNLYGFEGFLRDLEAYNNMGPVSGIQQNYAVFDELELMVYDLEVMFQSFVDEIVAYEKELKVNRWLVEFQGFLDDLKASDNMGPVSQDYGIRAEFDGLMTFDEIMTNELKNINVTTPDEEFKKTAVTQVTKEAKEDLKLKKIVKEENEDEDCNEEFDEYFVRKHMGAKRSRLSSKKYRSRRV